MAELAKLQLPAITKVHLKSPEIQFLRTKLVLRHKLTLHRVACEQIIRSLIRLHGGNIGMQFSGRDIATALNNQMSAVRAAGGIDLSGEVLPLFELALGLRKFLRRIDLQLKAYAKAHPICSRFLEVPGVGPICAVSFYTAIEEPSRFRRASDVGPYLGMTPRVSQSGMGLQHGRISRAGNKLTRSHLTCAASAALSSRIANHPLKEWGLRLAKRAGGKKARIAVARRLAVIMLALWKNGSRYDPALLAANNLA